MRFTVTRKVLKDSLQWVIVDQETGDVVSDGSYVSCSNLCRELNNNFKPKQLTQFEIDGAGEHRKPFVLGMTQLRAAIAGSLRKAW